MDTTKDRYQRVRLILGEQFELLRHKRLVIFGVGGVGSYCLDALYRTGVTDITIVDSDTYEVSNQNRQIGSEAIGEVKVQKLAQLYPGITPFHSLVDSAFLETFDFTPYDLVLDAIDDIPAKVGIAQRCHEKLIASMGAAKKLDPTQIRCVSMWQTYNDPFAEKLSDSLKAVNFHEDFPVIFSPEEPQCLEKGSFVGVTGAFGLALAAQTIKMLLKV